eukprot:3909007-Rhodomonas_salina.3
MVRAHVLPAHPCSTAEWPASSSVSAAINACVADIHGCFVAINGCVADVPRSTYRGRKPGYLAREQQAMSLVGS